MLKPLHVKIRMASYFLGVDIGGSKSHAVIADETGRIHGFGKAGAGISMNGDYSRLIRVLGEIVSQATEQAGIAADQIAGAGFGIANYDWPSQREPHLQAIGTLGLNAPVGLVNDAIPGLLAASPRGWGICVTAGTGCNCRGWDANRREGRVTGFGLRYGEGAGATEMVARAIQVVSTAWTLLTPPTRLTDVLVRAAGAKDVVDLLEGLTLDRYSIPPSVAPEIFRVAAEGDAVAQDIIRWAGAELGRMAIAVCRQLKFEDLDFDLVLVGRVVTGSPRLIDARCETVYPVAPGAQLIHLTAPPVIGSVLLGMEQAGLDREQIGRARAALLAASLEPASKT